MRIALFSDTYTPDINGVVSSIVTLQHQLEKMGNDVFIITNHKALSMKREGNIIHLPGLELKWLYGYKFTTPYHFAAKDMIAKMNLDVIHVHTEFGVGFFGRIVAHHLNIPLISTYHTMYEDYTHYWNKFHINEVDRASKKFVSSFSRAISDNAQAVISPSYKTKETLLGYGVKTPIYVIPTGIDFSFFSKDNIDQVQLTKLKSQYGIKKDDHVVVFVGRIAEEKSIEIPLSAMQYVSDKSIKFLIVGGGPQLDELKEMAKKLELEDVIIFTDKVVRDEIPLYYAMANAFVSASLSETQGMTFLEAMSSGLPLFARYDEVLDDLLIDKKNGFYFSSEQEFAQLLQMYMNKDKKEQQIFEDAALAKTKPFDVSIFTTKVLSVYHQAIEDYKNAYEIIKIKRNGDYVTIQVENDFDDQPIRITLEATDYYQYKMDLSTKLDRYTVAELLLKDKRIHAYRSCLKKLSARDYASGELYNLIKRLHNLSDEEAKSIIEELEIKGYLNDERYMKERIEKLQYRFMGKSFIERSLEKRGFNSEMIEAELNQIDDEQEIARAKKLTLSIVHTIKDTSKYMARQKLIKKLITFGFSQSVAIKTIEDVSFPNLDEQAALNKQFTKALSTCKNEATIDNYQDKVVRVLLNKKFKYEDIQILCKEIDWEETYNDK